MKKRILSLMLIFVLLLACGCQRQSVNNNYDPEELYNYEVTHEPFEDMPIMSSFSNYITYKTEQELFDDSELVIIGMPLDTFTDGKQRFFDIDANEVTKDSGVQIFHSITTRDIKILKILKGTFDKEIIEVADEAITRTDENSNLYIFGLPDNDFIPKKNVKYIYYLNKGAQDNMDFYVPRADQGKVNIDGLDSNSVRMVSDTRLNEVKAHFAAEFEKYDRSSELAAK